MGEFDGEAEAAERGQVSVKQSLDFKDSRAGLRKAIPKGRKKPGVFRSLIRTPP